MRRLATVALTAAAVAYLLLKIDIGRTAHIVASARPLWVVLAAVLTVVTVFPMAWRWQRLLRAKGVEESLPWLTRAYLVSYAVGQVLPTSLGGDASRIFGAARRHPGATTPIAGSVLVERALGGAVTICLAAVGFVVAYGRYSVGAYLWVELLFAVGTFAVGVVFFSRTMRGALAFAVPLARRLRVERVARAVYEGIHGYRSERRALAVVAAVTLVVQLSRVAAVYASARAVGIDLSPLPYIVFAPMLFLVLLAPFTVNGVGIREAFFVSFLGKLHVGPNAAFACGFLFFVMTILLAAPGGAILVWESLSRRRAVLDGAV